LHRINAAIRSRAIHPSEPIPPPSERLTKFSHPPDELVEKSKKYLEKLMEVAEVKEGPWTALDYTSFAN
jgi:ATP-dependent DNA helicase 2 subunit 2